MNEDDKQINHIENGFMEACSAFGKAKRSASDAGLISLAEGLALTAEGLKGLANQIRNIRVRLDRIDPSTME
jgi:hypothetical protein